MACCATATVGAETLEECALLANISVLAVGGHEPAVIQIGLKVENHRISGSLRLLTADGIQTEDEKDCSGRGCRGYSPNDASSHQALPLQDVERHRASHARDSIGTRASGNSERLTSV
jgi:hypothetical protein